MPEPCVSVREVARHLGMAKESVYRWIEAKGLPAHRVGSLWKFRLSEVDKWIEIGNVGREQTRNVLDEPRSKRHALFR